VSRVFLKPSGPLRGTCAAPGDKSITQRAILIGALASGETRIVNPNPGADAAAAAGVVRALGVDVRRRGGTWLVRGGALAESDRVLDARNSGTTLRLGMGLLAGRPFYSVLTGDDSLRRRPVARVIEPLRAFGAEMSARREDTLPPVTIRGRRLRGASVKTGLPSAQVKSALLLAAVQAEGLSEITEPAATRDHTERMLERFGAVLEREADRIRVAGPVSLRGAEIPVPGDLSAAAFLIAAATLVPRSDIRIDGVGVNPTRRAFVDLLIRLGARIDVEEPRDLGGEPVADLRVRAGSLRAFRLAAADAVGLIDELPLLAVLAAFAEGTSTIRGASELRAKESDRIEAVAEGLRAIGARVEAHDDGWTVEGRGAVRGGPVESKGDHRIAMAFLVAGLRAKNGVAVTGAQAARVSDPEFLPRLRRLRA
jgi:3-phosphoshikimate 1-carboxyvinyltransferase